MRNIRKITTGLLFTGALALTLLASGDDAYAKVKGAGGHAAAYGDGTIPITPPAMTDELFRTLGVTWE